VSCFFRCFVSFFALRSWWWQKYGDGDAAVKQDGGSAWRVDRLPNYGGGCGRFGVVGFCVFFFASARREGEGKSMETATGNRLPTCGLYMFCAVSMLFLLRIGFLPFQGCVFLSSRCGAGGGKKYGDGDAAVKLDGGSAWRVARFSTVMAASRALLSLCILFFRSLLYLSDT